MQAHCNIPFNSYVADYISSFELFFLCLYLSPFFLSFFFFSFSLGRCTNYKCTTHPCLFDGTGTTTWVFSILSDWKEIWSIRTYSSLGYITKASKSANDSLKRWNYGNEKWKETENTTKIPHTYTLSPALAHQIASNNQTKLITRVTNNVRLSHMLRILLSVHEYVACAQLKSDEHFYALVHWKNHHYIHFHRKYFIQHIFAGWSVGLLVWCIHAKMFFFSSSLFTLYSSIA